MRRAVLVWALMAPLAGCTCATTGEADSGVVDGGTTEQPTLTQEEIEHLEDCFAQSGPVDPALVRDAARALLRPDDGTVDLPLRPDGCWRVRRTMRAGVASRFEIVLDVGLVYDPVTYVPVAPLRVVFVRFERDAAGVMTGGVDTWPNPEDPFAEVQVRADPATRRFERTLAHPTTRAILERRVLEAVAADRYRERVEELVGGALVVVRDEELEPGSYKQAGAGDVATPCSPANAAALDAALADVVASAVGCLGRGAPSNTSTAGADLVKTFEAWGHASMARSEWYCFPSGAVTKGEWSPSNQLGQGPIQIAAQPGISNLSSTLFHELMHAVQGGHPRATSRLEADVNEAVRTGDRAAYERWRTMLAYTDPVYACENLCSGDSTALRNRCTCAACLGVRPCDEPCRSLPSCLRTTVDGASVPPYASEAAGTSCQPNGVSPATAQISWYSTLAECESSCPGAAAGTSTCSSRSRSCVMNCK